MRVVCIFIDGIGIGGENPATNPCWVVNSPLFPQAIRELAALPFGGICLPTDASLGVAGLPQSATGQTTLFTGLNAAQQIGTHVSGFATPRLIEMLRQESMFIKTRQLGKTAAFANAYSREFFEMPDKQRARMTSVTTAATLTAELPFLFVEQIREGRSLYHDFTNATLRKRGYDMPLFSPQYAGKQLARLSQAHDLCLYEYFLTDRVGHFGQMEAAAAEVEKLHEFLTAVLEHTDLTSTVVVVCSDHGNLEDVSVITHTANPVPTLIWGNAPPNSLAAIRSLTDITPFLLASLQCSGSPALRGGQLETISAA